MATRLQDLRLHERALLLALDDDRGVVHSGSMYSYAIAGGILAELLLDERVRLEERKRGQPLLTLASATQTGDRVIDDALEKIRNAKRRAPLSTWVAKFAGTGLKHQVAVQLARKGVLRTGEDRVLLLFRRKIYPELDPAPERDLVASLRHAILSDDDDLDPRTAILAALAWRAGLLRPVLDKKELKARKDRLEALGRGDPVAGATKAAIDAMHAAIIAATTAATAATMSS